MNQPLRIFKYIQTTAIVAMALLYGLAPLQQPLTEGFHKLEHALLNTDDDHSHDVAHKLELDHSHEHQLLAFFNDLIEDQSSEDEQSAKEFKLDKHVLQEHLATKNRLILSSDKNFNYQYSPYLVSLPFQDPPPKHHFS